MTFMCDLNHVLLTWIALLNYINILKVGNFESKEKINKTILEQAIQIKCFWQN